MSTARFNFIFLKNHRTLAIALCWAADGPLPVVVVVSGGVATVAVGHRILTAKFSSKLLDARQKELSLYLEGLIKQPELGTCPSKTKKPMPDSRTTTTAAPMATRHRSMPALEPASISW